MSDPSSATFRRPPARRRGFLRFTGVLLFISILFGFVFVYPTVRIGRLVWPSWEPAAWQVFALFVFPIGVRVLRERLPLPGVRLLTYLTMQLVGLAFGLLPVVLIWEVINWIHPLNPEASKWLFLGLATLLGVGGWYAAAFPVVRKQSILAPELAGSRLVQLSDVHLGSGSPRFIRRIASRVKSLNADRIVITGDLIDASGAEAQHLAPLVELGVPIFYVIGNHERYVDLERIDSMLRGLGMTVLRNEAAQSGPIQFIGIDDSEHPEQVARQLAQIAVSTEHFPILLYHRPTEFEAAANAGIRLMLSGHTHSGQIFPFNFAVRKAFPRHTGRHELGESTLYVSQGTGTWGPTLRIGTRSEITLFCFDGS